MSATKQVKSSKKSKSEMSSKAVWADSTKLFYISVCFFVLSLILLVSAFIVQRHGSTSKTAQPSAGYSINTPVTAGQASIEVNKISFSNGQPGFTSPADQHYIVTDISIKNNSEQPIDILPSTDTYVKDQSGRTTYLTPYGLTEPFRAGKLLPGETIKGQLSYIATKTGDVRLFVDSIWSGGVVVFKLQ